APRRRRDRLAGRRLRLKVCLVMGRATEGRSAHHKTKEVLMAKPLPLVTPENEFFWKAGAEGALRFQKCAGCAALLHPPGPVCPYCGSDEIGVATVSGRGVVAGYTVNYQQWSPDFPPPYILAVVAIDEDPRVRLTTNLVDCVPEDAKVGLRVQVRFEERGDVWLPLF